MPRIALVFVHSAALTSARTVGLAEQSLERALVEKQRFRDLTLLSLTHCPTVAAHVSSKVRAPRHSESTSQVNLLEQTKAVDESNACLYRAERTSGLARRRSHDIVERLRGGSVLAQVSEDAKRIYLALPLATRAWLTAVLILSVITRAGLEQRSIGLDAEATLEKFQLWRPITAAAFVGGLGPAMLLQLFYLASYGRELETLLGLPAFARDLASCGLVLTVLFELLGWRFTGKGLIAAVVMMNCLQNANSRMSIYPTPYEHFKIPYKYLPYLQLFLVLLFTKQIPLNEILGFCVGSLTWHTKPHTADLEARASKAFQSGKRAVTAIASRAKHRVANAFNSTTSRFIPRRQDGNLSDINNTLVIAQRETNSSKRSRRSLF